MTIVLSKQLDDKTANLTHPTDNMPNMLTPNEKKKKKRSFQRAAKHQQQTLKAICPEIYKSFPGITIFIIYCFSEQASVQVMQVLHAYNLSCKCTLSRSNLKRSATAYL